jgi:cytochrome d ubiquinol oxidase subunit II
MVEAWYAIFWFMLAVYAVLDGRNFGAGALQMIVAKSAPERRQVVAAIGPLWSWHEVWLVAAGGVLFVAFPRVMATAFSGYYLALFVLLWSLILRGMSIEVAGQVDHPLWQSFWDFVFVAANVLLAVLLGIALGNIIRGVPLDSNGDFHIAFFTNFGVRGNVGLLDWFTVSFGLFSLLILAAYGATYLTLKTEGPVRERSEQAACRLWVAACAIAIVVFVEAWFVRPELFVSIARKLTAWVFLAVTIAGAVAVFVGINRGLQRVSLGGYCALIAGALTLRAAAAFPIMLYSTLDFRHSLSAYDGSSSEKGLIVAFIWWPIALVLTSVYFTFFSHSHRAESTFWSDTRSGS